MMSKYVLRFPEIDKTKLMIVGGKGANLGELSRIDGIQVPEGVCITTGAYKVITESDRQLNGLLEDLTRLKSEDREKIKTISARIRMIIEETPIPTEITEAITAGLSTFKENDAFAIRSSATAEDLPTASFAGQQDTWLNIIGRDAILKHISRCWASLFTGRAVTYRHQNGIDHRKVQLAVVVQKMVFPQAAGVLFTADPVTSNRKVLSIDAGFGLGDALVSGLVNPDSYKVRNGKITDKKISSKKLGIYAVAGGGTKRQEIEAEHQNRQVLTDEQILQLEQTGRRIEAHFGHPQDIEWGLADNQFYIVQSRPITTLYPIPEAEDRENHVYVSVGHQQMMTDPVKPLGISMRQLTATRSMKTAGGRWFVDVTPELRSPARRHILVEVLGKSDPLIKGALMTILEREDFIKLEAVNAEEPAGKANKENPSPDFQTLKDFDPAIVSTLIRRSQTSIDELKQKIRSKNGTDLMDLILEDIQILKKNMSDPQSFGVFMTAMNASSWINDKMKEWLGEKNAADVLTQSVSNNVTSEMGLDLLDVADVIRPYPELVSYLQNVTEDSFLDQLVKFKGGREARKAIMGYLDKYGMRCTGEIDITRPRWSEKPITLVPMILNNVKSCEPGAAHRKFEQGRQEALKKERDLIGKLKQLPDGEQKAAETKRMIDLVRNLIGYREYPKYDIVSRYFVYKQALLKEAELLVEAGVIREKEDIYYLSFEELRGVISANQVEHAMIDRRKGEYRSYEKLTPPRVMTSDGEILSGRYKEEDLPVGAIPGLPVSSGIVEGRARVILNIEDADLEEGDILVTPFTDPGWTPLFISIKGLVTEVGGRMTHGAVIAREYGLPAVVGIENASKLVKDGQRIRVNGTDGYVEIL